jgi:hypothetical protein
MLGDTCVQPFTIIPTAAIQVLTSNDKTRAVNASELLAQLLNVAATCDGEYPVLWRGQPNLSLSSVFTAEHRRKLSNVMDVQHPFFSHSPASSVSGHSSRREPGTPDPVFGQSSRMASQRPSRVQTNLEFGELANQFGVEPRLVEALAQKLSGMC